MVEKIPTTRFLRKVTAVLILPLIFFTSFSYPRPAQASFLVPVLLSAIMNSILPGLTFLIVDATSCWLNTFWGCSNTAQDGTVTTINLPPVPVTLSASPNPIDQGQSTTLTWSSTGADSCTAAGGGNWFPSNGGTSGNVTVGPLTADQNYQVICTNGAGSTNSNIVTVIVRIPTVTINATPDRVVTTGSGGSGGSSGSGGITTVSWDATNVNSCTITKNGVVWQTLIADASRTVAGSATTTVASQTKFIINCANDASATAVAATASKIVNVVSSFKEF